MAADDGRNCRHAIAFAPQRLSNSWNGENRSDAVKGIRGTEDDRVRGGDCFAYATCGRCLGSALEAHVQNFIARAALDEVSLELEFAGRRANARSNAIIRHGNDARAYSQRHGYFRGYVGKRRALTQALCAIDMD